MVAPGEVSVIVWVSNQGDLVAGLKTFQERLASVRDAVAELPKEDEALNEDELPKEDGPPSEDEG